MSFGFSIFPEALRWLWRDYPGVKSEGIVNSSPETIIGEWDVETIVWDEKLTNVLTLTSNNGILSATFKDQKNNQYAISNVIFKEDILSFDLVIPELAEQPLAARGRVDGDQFDGTLGADDEGMLIVVAKIFPHGAARIRGDILQCRRVAGTSCNNRRIFHGPVFFKGGNDLCNCRFFLAAGYINAVNIRILLVDDGIHDKGCFPDLAVTNDKFPLAAAHRCHGIYGLKTGVTRFVYAFTGDDTGCDHFNPAVGFCLDRPLAV